MPTSQALDISDNPVELPPVTDRRWHTHTDCGLIAGSLKESIQQPHLHSPDMAHGFCLCACAANNRAFRPPRPAGPTDPERRKPAEKQVCARSVQQVPANSRCETHLMPGPADDSDNVTVLDSGLLTYMAGVPVLAPARGHAVSRSPHQPTMHPVIQQPALVRLGTCCDGWPLGKDLCLQTRSATSLCKAASPGAKR